MPSITAGLLLALALATPACATTDDADPIELDQDGGKADGGPVRYRLTRSEAGYRPLNDALDTWAHGLLTANPMGGNQFEVIGPWYKVTPDLSSGLWWRMDVRKAEGEARVEDVPDKGLAFLVLWREVGGGTWTFLKPEVTTETGKSSAVGLFTSFEVGPGRLEVQSPLLAEPASSDFFWNDLAPEFAFVPVPYDTVDKIPGVAQFEIAITEAE